MLVLMLRGRRPAPSADARRPARRSVAAASVLAVVALVMLIVCFTPAPIEPFVTGQ